jgi:hypothetical protein
MTDPGQFGVAITLAKTTLTSLKTLLNLEKEAEFTLKEVELAGVIRTLQSSLSQAECEISDMRLQIENLKAKLSDWEKTESEYETFPFVPGVLVYLKKEIVESDQPDVQNAQKLCVQCFENRQKGVIQQWKHNHYKCGGCGFEFVAKNI